MSSLSLSCSIPPANSMTTFSPFLPSASAVASDDVVLLQISARTLASILDREAQIGKTVYFNLALTLVDRLRQDNQELDLVLPA